MGAPDALTDVRRLQPAQLPQRFGVATRHRAGRGRRSEGRPVRRRRRAGRRRTRRSGRTVAAARPNCSPASVVRSSTRQSTTPTPVHRRPGRRRRRCSTSALHSVCVRRIERSARRCRHDRRSPTASTSTSCGASEWDPPVRRDDRSGRDRIPRGQRHGRLIAAGVDAGDAPSADEVAVALGRTVRHGTVTPADPEDEAMDRQEPQRPAVDTRWAPRCGWRREPTSGGRTICLDSPNRISRWVNDRGSSGRWRRSSRPWQRRRNDRRRSRGSDPGRGRPPDRPHRRPRRGR